jgi:hypothetical protein
LRWCLKLFLPLTDTFPIVSAKIWEGRASARDIVILYAPICEAPLVDVDYVQWRFLQRQELQWRCHMGKIFHLTF